MVRKVIHFLFTDWYGGYIVGILITTMGGMFAISQSNNHTCPQIKPCNHLTEQQVVLKYEKYCMFVDSLYSCKRKDVIRLTDSLLKFKIK